MANLGVPAEPGDDLTRAFEAQGRAVAERVLAEGREPRTWFNQKTGAEYAHCSVPHFNKLMQTGKGPRSVRFGGGIRIKRQWLDQWIEAGGANAAGE